MSGQDFFTYCTSLKPLERRELGLLSTVRHLGAAQTIYRAGEPSESLYIINRGMVEMLAEESSRTRAATYLSRGDIFGDLEMLTNLPRKHRVRTCENVSLQIFHRRNLAELERRVPSFFRYLSEQLASRLLEARDLALARSHCLELSGSLSNFDLVTIFQTISNSSQSGELSILDETGELRAAFVFESGQALRGQFQHLTGEEAFTQLFLAEDLHGTFSFSTSGGLIGSAFQAGRLGQPLDELLINAARARDEFEALKVEFSDPLAVLRRARPELVPALLPEDLRPVAEEIWQQAAGLPGLDRLYAHCSASELKIYQAVKALLESGHLQLADSITSRKVA